MDYKLKANIQSIQFYGSALLLSFCCCFLFFPGLFSDDSVSQWQQALTHSYSNWHPVIMALVMHYLKPIFWNGGIFCLHQLLYWLCIALAIDLLYKKKILLLLLGFFPQTFLISICVWKDTGMFIGLALSFLLFIKYIRGRNKYFFIVSMLCLLYASLVRLNGFIPSASLLFCYILYISRNKKIIYSLCAILIFAITLKLSNSFLNYIYDVKQTNPLPTLMLWDIAAIEKLSNIDDGLPKYITVYDKDKALKWLDGYDPYSCSLCFGKGYSCDLANKENSLISDWVYYIKTYPKSYIKHRWKFTKMFFGFSKNAFYPYHRLEQNKRLGKNFPINWSGEQFFNLEHFFAKILQSLFLYQAFPYIIFELFLIIIFLYKYIKNKIDIQRDFVLITLSLSGITNAFSLAIIAPAADYRYIIWTVLSAIFAFVVFCNKKWFLDGQGRAK